MSHLFLSSLCYAFPGIATIIGYLSGLLVLLSGLIFYATYFPKSKIWKFSFDTGTGSPLPPKMRVYSGIAGLFFLLVLMLYPIWSQRLSDYALSADCVSAKKKAKAYSQDISLLLGKEIEDKRRISLLWYQQSCDELIEKSCSAIEQNIARTDSLFLEIDQLLRL